MSDLTNDEHIALVVSNADDVVTLDLTPTPAQYREMLQFIRYNSTEAEDRLWALEELVRIGWVDTWATPPAREVHGA